LASFPFGIPAACNQALLGAAAISPKTRTFANKPEDCIVWIPLLTIVDDACAEVQYVQLDSGISPAKSSISIRRWPLLWALQIQSLSMIMTQPFFSGQLELAAVPLAAR
jgi:hypothetical protein